MRSNGDITAVVHIVYDEKAVKKVEATYHGGDGSTKVETFDKLSAALIWVGQRLEEAGQ